MFNWKNTEYNVILFYSWRIILIVILLKVVTYSWDDLFWKDRLQTSLYFCAFKYARAVKRKVWNEAENRERYGRVRLARFARVSLLRHALPISLLILRKKLTVLQSRRIVKWAWLRPRHDGTSSRERERYSIDEKIWFVFRSHSDEEEFYGFDWVCKQLTF